MYGMYILFDIGATNMRFAGTEDDSFESFCTPLILDTPKDFKIAMEDIRDVIEKIADGDEIDGVVGGIAGVLSSEKDMLDRSPNLPDWEGKPLKESLMDITGCNPVIFNDADLSGLGEAVFGSGADADIVMYVTSSTGYGGGLIVDKEIARHHIGFEPGFQIIDHENYTTLHEFIAGSELRESHGKPAKEIEDPDVWKCVLDKMTIGINNSIVHWSPDKVVLGGSVMQRFSIEDIEKRVGELMKIFPTIPKFERAMLGDVNGIYGALAYLKKKLT
ncbi:MAG: glucokinase [Candidatus Paceibacteria bacterium]|jgi:glucokinase